MDADKHPKFASAFMKHPVTRFILLLFFAGFIMADGTMLSGCANMIPPSGGPRDSIPPVLLGVTPPDSTTGFRSKRIVFTFNEFVEANNPMENVIVSPTPRVMPSVNAHLRTVTVVISDTLEQNTTYAINFGNSIRDINEGNQLKDFTYIFSTGTYFDSLTLSGKVILAETGGTDSTLIVMLHRNLEDSAVYHERPRYYTRVKADGSFQFRYLPAGSFAIYALEDQGGTRQYRSLSQLFAFADQPVQTGANPQPITLYAYRGAPNTPRGQTGAGTGATGGRPGRAAAPQDKVLRIQTNIVAEQLDLLSDLQITFATPLRTFDTTRIRFTDEQYNTIPRASFVLDTSRKVVTLKFPWASGGAYNIIVNKDFAEDTLGRKLLKDDTLSFKARRESEYGSLRLRFLNLDMSKNPVLLFVQGDEVKHTHVFTGRDVVIRLFNPGEYELRILYDENRNGKYDPGEFFGKHRQPERIIPVPRRLNVKPNWDNEVDITLE